MSTGNPRFGPKPISSKVHAEHDREVTKDGGRHIYEGYVEELLLKPEDLDKKILDVGSGTAGFAKWANENHKNAQVFSLDPYDKFSERTKSAKAKAEAIPFADEAFDLVVSNGAVPNVLQRSFGEDIEMAKERVKRSLLEMARVVKPGGEIRLGRLIREVDPSSPMFISNQVLDGAFNELKEKYAVEIEEIHTPPDFYEYSESGEKLEKLVAEAHLAIIRKPLKTDPHTTV